MPACGWLDATVTLFSRRKSVQNCHMPSFFSSMTMRRTVPIGWHMEWGLVRYLDIVWSEIGLRHRTGLVEHGGVVQLDLPKPSLVLLGELVPHILSYFLAYVA